MHMSYPFRNDAYLTKLTSARNLNGRKVLALEELPSGRWKCQPEGWVHASADGKKMDFLCVKPENLDRLPGPDTSGRTGDALEREGFYRQMRARSGAPVAQPEPRFLTDEEKAELLALGNPNEAPRCAWNELSKHIKAAHGGVYPDDWHRMVNLGGLWQPVTDAHAAADEAQLEAAAAAIADKFGIRDSTWARERTNRDLPPEQQAPRKAVLDVHAPPSHPVKPGTPLPKALQDVLKSGGAHDVFTTALRFYQAKVLGMVCEAPYNGAPLLGFEAETDKGVEVVDGFLIAYFDEGTQKMLTLQLDSLLDKQFHCMSSALTEMLEAKDPGRGARAREEARAIAASIERAKATVAAEEAEKPPPSPPCSPPESEDEGVQDVHPALARHSFAWLTGLGDWDGKKIQLLRHCSRGLHAEQWQCRPEGWECPVGWGCEGGHFFVKQENLDFLPPKKCELRYGKNRYCPPPPPPEGGGERLHRIGESVHFELHRSAEGLLYVGFKVEETPDPVIFSTVPRAVVSKILERMWPEEEWLYLAPAEPAEPAEPEDKWTVAKLSDIGLRYGPRR